MTAPDDAAAAALWRAFVTGPADSVDEGRLAACFNEQLGSDLCRRLKACRRLAARLSDLIRDRYGLAPWVAASACAAGDRAIALAPADDLRELIRRSGAIYWSAAIANVVLADQVAALHQQLGEALCSFAIGHRDLAGPPRSAAPFATFAQRVVERGERCLAAWCAAQPREVGLRVRLKLAPSSALEGEPDAGFVELGCAILRRAAA